MSESQRLAWPDCAKGMLIVLVTVGHALLAYYPDCQQPYATGIVSYVCKIIYSFHMPMFFAISGFLTAVTGTRANVSIAANIFKRSVGLVLPTAAVVLFEFILLLIEGAAVFSPIFIIKLLPWFTVCLTVLFALSSIMHPLIRNKRMWILYLTVLFIIGCAVDILPFGFADTVARWAGFLLVYEMGYLISKHQIYAVKWNILGGGLYVISMVSFILLHGSLSGWVRIVLGVPFCFVALSVFPRIKRCEKAYILQYLGRNSLAVYLLHFMFMGVINTDNSQAQILNVLFLSVVFTFTPLGLVECLKKHKYTDFIFNPIKYMKRLR